MASGKIHWLAPTAMLVALVCAAFLALGHHYFYASLENRPTPAGSYHVVGRTISKQQLNIAVGSAFAFLVKASLAVAVATSYMQTFWRAMKRMKNPPTLVELDCTFSALGNLMSLLKVKHWWRHPMLLLLVIIGW